MSRLSESRLAELKEMEHIPVLEKGPVTQVQLVQYAGASGDYNRIHIDKEFADQTPLKGVIAHGMLSMGFLGQYLDQLTELNLEVKQFKVRFRAMVRVGDRITCTGKVIQSNEKSVVLEIRAANQNGDLVTVGEAVLEEQERGSGF